MQQEPSQKQFLRLAIPNIIAGLSLVLSELIDLAYLGRLDDPLPLAGVVLATVIFDYLFWGSAFLRMGTTGPTAQSLGAEDLNEQAAIFWRSLSIGMTLATIVVLLQIPIGELGLSLLVESSDIATPARDYYYILIWSMFPALGFMAIMGWLLGMHRADYSMISMLAMNVSNMVLNYFLVLEMGLGAYGAGLGTLIAIWIGFAVALILAFVTWNGIPRFDRKQIFCRNKLYELITLNGNIFLRTIIIVTIFATFTKISANFSTATLTANAILMRLFIFYAHFSDGFATALESLSGKYYGARRPELFARSIRLAMGWSFATALLCSSIFLLFDHTILKLLNPQPEVIAIGKQFLPMICVAMLITGFAFIYDGLFMGLANGRQLRNSMLAGALAFAPFALLALKMDNNYLLFIGLVVSGIMRALIHHLPVRKMITHG